MWYIHTLKVVFRGSDSNHEPLEIECEEFVDAKGFKAKGKRVSTLDISDMVEIKPLRFPEPEEETVEEVEQPIEEENLDPDAGKSQQEIIITMEMI